MGLLNPLETLDDFLDDPIGTTIRETTQPFRDTYDILEGLTEGEIRTQAALRLGADIVAGMALSEIITYLKNH
jgi:hypothetical protein